MAQLQREAEARRGQAGTYQEQAEKKKTEVESVTVPAVPEAELRAKAEVGIERWLLWCFARWDGGIWAVGDGSVGFIRELF